MYEDLVKRLRDAAKMSEALAVLLPHSEGNATAKLYKEAADAIEELSRLHEAQRQNLITLMNEDPEMEWIPVTERLPERGYYVLAYEDGDILMASYADGNWVLRDMYEVIDDLKPTHWMPLPSAPTEE